MTTNNLVFLDTETSGLDTRLHDVIEAAWAVNDEPVLTIVFPHTLDHADNQALAINGYFERGLDARSGFRADDSEDLELAFIRDLRGSTIVAENYGFDVAMLCQKLGFEPWHYRKVELSSVAMTVFDLDRPEGIFKTAARLRELGYDIPESDHTAEADVECLRACYKTLRGGGVLQRLTEAAS